MLLYRMGEISAAILLVTIGSCASTSGDDDAGLVITSLRSDIQLKVNESSRVGFELDSGSTAATRVWFDSSSLGVIGAVPRPFNVRGPERNFSVRVRGAHAGKTVLSVHAGKKPDGGLVDDKDCDAFVRITVVHSRFLDVVADVVGWLYFVAWSVSFYPQIYENWKRKSVIGLNFDFLSLNIVGFVLYSLFNIGLLWIKPIQELYFSDHPFGVNPVQLNDVIFSLHAVAACALTIFQCTIYERGNQVVSRACRLLHLLLYAVLGLCLVLAACTAITWLDFLYACSYGKLVITLVKYVPQAYMNYRRKSTMGWSIGNVLLDFTGGALSIAQMFILAYNNDDWSSIFGDPTKFGLGLFSVLFDVFFMLQHYVFYRNSVPHEELIDNGPDGDDAHSEDHEVDNLSESSSQP